MSFLDDRKKIRLIRTCKQLYNHGKEYGYMSFIKADLSTNMMTFIQRFCQHSHSVKTIHIRGVDDPHIWIPHYVENIIFEHCSVNSYVNPGKQAHVTKRLKLIDYKFNTIVKINWECFPNLEELDLYIHDVNLDGLEKLKHLKRININTNTRLITQI